MQYQIIAPAVDVHEAPEKRPLRGKFETQLVMGEIFTVEEEKNGWCKGTCVHDGYAGFIESKYLTKAAIPPTHVVTAVRSYIYEDKTFKSHPVQLLSFGSRIRITGRDNNYLQLDNNAWIYEKHTAPINMLDKDHTSTAMKFLETPYYWGGRSGFGIDCSGLIQVSLARAGIHVLRDTEIQEDKIGTLVQTLKTGDIVYFPGHVGIMADDTRLLHANAFHMKVTVEALDEVIARGIGITSIRRL